MQIGIEKSACDDGVKKKKKKKNSEDTPFSSLLTWESKKAYSNLKM
jgi:hypothetical protein